MRAHRCGKTATKKPNRSETVGQPCKIRPWKQAVEIAIFLALQQRKKAVTSFLSQPVGCGDRTWTCDLRVMRNLRFVHYSAVLLGLVVLRTKAQNGFYPMCTKRCYTVLNRFKPFWGQFWEQIRETDSHTHRLNTCAALVSLRNMNTSITGFLPVKSPTNPYISFTL